MGDTNEFTSKYRKDEISRFGRDCRERGRVYDTVETVFDDGMNEGDIVKVRRGRHCIACKTGTGAHTLASGILSDASGKLSCKRLRRREIRAKRRKKGIYIELCQQAGQVREARASFQLLLFSYKYV